MCCVYEEGRLERIEGMLECVRKEGGKVAAKREQEGKANKRKFQGLRVPTYTIVVIRVRLFSTMLFEQKSSDGL